MTQLGKFEKYLIEEFFDDYRSGALSQRTFTRRVAFITGSMAAAAAAMLLVGCTPEEVPRSTDPMPTPSTPASSPESGSVTPGPVPGAKSPLSVPEGAPGLATETVRFPSDEAEISAYLARPEGGAAGPAVLVCHENRGLTPHIQDVARRFAKAGYAALALDLLSREGGTASFDRDAVPGALTQAGAQRHVSDFTAAFDYLNSQTYVDQGRIAMTGYCFGGGITWQAATDLPGLKATAAFYGPSPDLAKVPTIKPAAFGVYAELDQRITGAMPALRDALAATDVRHQLTVYPGVDHAFHNDTGDRYVEAQATAAWNDTLAWFTKYV
ncbi:carboxymethylenebutenolidase [Arthrobacter sp. V4I6]|uniref:dienelactone hydrolase family protein n=1 Tax=unclassified Arthrobacter TaxID=235627 RepID=UPI002785C798|nr:MULTISPECIES: dienelactone hydrolase family protein [unclassified Arthrobacter]MDQ0821260.1 carboxymethylenebutenolidase [Arthrobacter sp. V1I7]MDQ0855523.1 carboxymethylenebutenolidase [Arthrobacter sp. V4I6]